MPPPSSCAPAAPSDNRVKQTFACEPCRKRKAKCSGLSPCVLCQKSGLECVFVYERQRRGRKARSTAPGTAPLDLSSNNEVVHNAPSSKTSGPGRSPWPPQLHHALLDDLNSRNTGDGPEHDPSMLAALVPHLLDLFFDRVATQFPPFIRKAHFLRYISEADCPTYLSYALSVMSLQWSAHRCVQDSQVRSRVEQRLVGYVRSAQQYQLHPNQLLSCVQAYCALIAHQACQGYGLKAWADLGAATNIADLLSLQDNVSSTTKEAMQLTKDFLSSFKALFSIGHPELRRLDSRDFTVTLDGTPSVRATTDSFSLSSVCFLLARIYTEAALGFTDSTPPPWSSKSAFISLRQSLDRIRLTWPDSLPSHGLDPLQSKAESHDATHEWLSVLLWHTCVIVLNNVFLPIPAHSSEYILNFPRAPQQFSQERIQACEASAAEVARICRYIMSQDAIFPSPLLGYSCFQSALVFLNQIRRARPTIPPEIVLYLKVVLTMLGAVRNFYKPASLWIRTFMDIHGGLDQSTKKPTITGPIETDNTSNLFKNFAARFPGVGHISFIPFETKEQLEQAVNQTLSPITQPAQPTPPEIVTSDDDIRHDWMSAYDSHLDNDLAVDNDLESDHVADRLRPCRIDDTTASYGRSLELISDWYPTDEFLFAHDNTKFPVDDTLQHLMSGIGDTTDLSDALLTDMLDQGSELLSLQMGSLHPP